MDKKSIIGIVIIGLMFVGFVIYNNKQQEQYKAELAKYNEYVASQQPPQTAEKTDSLPLAAMGDAAMGGGATAQQDSTAVSRDVALLGESLAEAKVRDEQSLTVANDVLTVDFTSKGGAISGVTLKDYTRYAPNRQRTESVKMFVPESAQFNMSFYVKNGLNNLLVNTSDYSFEVAEFEKADTAQRVTMRLSVAPQQSVEYVYTIYNTGNPSRDYLIDYDVRFVNMGGKLANQKSVNIDWSQVSYQNEKGFKNENMYTTVSYHLPGESAIEELSMSEESKSESIGASLDWVAFKQQFFSSILIAKNDFSRADIKYTTEKPNSGFVKDFSTQLSFAVDEKTSQYDFAFYFGPNKYSILNNVEAWDDGSMSVERLIPLGWGIFGWVNRWFVIPVFDFLRNYIASFGLIILILAVLVKLIISPLTYKSYLSQGKMRVVKPEVDALNEKYPNSNDKDQMMRKQQATMELYKKAGINPLGGCIPMLIQMPIIIAMFRFFPASIELRDQAFLWADDLSSYDSILNLPFNIPFYGEHVSLFAILMALAMFAFSWMNFQQSSTPQMAGMKFMMLYMMPIMMLFMFNSYSSGLCYYYFLANMLTIAQTLIIRQFIDDDKIHAQMKAQAAKNKNKKKSKFQQRYEELLRQQQQPQQNAKKPRR